MAITHVSMTNWLNQNEVANPYAVIKLIAESILKSVTGKLEEEVDVD